MLQDNPDLYNRSILNGKRWNTQANQTYVMPANEFHTNFDSHNPAMVANVVQKFVERHSTIDAPRIAKLERYYLGDNDIHYWKNNKRMPIS